MNVEIGQPAPAFTAVNQDDQSVSLADFRGRPVVLYFYPKDDTPGCTKEACGFRDAWRELQARGAVVLGVSADSAEQHRKFKDKYDLPFALLADEDKQIIQAYGAWGEKKMYGKTRMGIIRGTVLIDADGVVRQVWPKVSPASHADEVLAALEALGEG